LEFYVITEIGLERGGHVNANPGDLHIFNLDNNLVSPVAKIQKTISPIAGNGLAKEKVSAFRIEQQLKGYGFQTAGSALVYFEIAKKSVATTLGRKGTGKKKDQEYR